MYSQLELYLINVIYFKNFYTVLYRLTQSKNIARHRTPTSVKVSDVQHACNFAQGKAWICL